MLKSQISELYKHFQELYNTLIFNYLDLCLRLLFDVIFFLNQRFENGNLPIEVNLNYVSTGLGLLYLF